MLNGIRAGLMLTLVLVAGPAAAETAPLPHLLSLSGHAEVKSTPDLAIVDLGTLSQAPTAKAALQANTKNMTALMTMLKAAGIDEKDIMTSNFSVGPRYDYGNNNNQPPKLVGYDVNNTVSVIVHKIDNLGAILDQAVSAGSNQIAGVSFTIENPQTQQDEARKAAVKDAMHKAELLIQAAGVKLGAIVTMNESGGAAPMPTPMMAKMARGMEMDAAKPVPIAQGQMTISSDVNIVWALE